MNDFAKTGALELLTADIKIRLLENGRKNAARINDDGNTIDFHPVVKLFTPDAGFTWLLTEIDLATSSFSESISGFTWLLTEIDSENEDVAFGLCDLGMGCPELGSVSLSEITALRGKLGLPVERDLHFEAEKSLRAYADEARLLGRIKN